LGVPLVKLGMFIRKKRNKSGSISVQIISKENGYYKVAQTVGSSRDVHEIERLVMRGEQVLHSSAPEQLLLFPVQSREELAVEEFVASLRAAQIRTVGPELIFGALFDRIGFNAVKDELFRHITIARLVYPTSKLKTADYLYRYQGRNLSVYTIYRFMDKLNCAYKETVEAIAYRHTKHRLKSVSVVFYDMTTLYFEAEDEDDLRKIGFSKNGKFQNPQIMLGLLVGEDGLPIGYDIFEGNTFEGHTLLPTLTKIQRKYGFDKPVVVADAGLLSRQNLRNLADGAYRFIIGARLKNEETQTRQDILGKKAGMNNGDSFEIKKPDGVRLIVSYSDKRAQKDAANRAKGVRKLRAHMKSGRLTKEHISNRGYNKFLTMSGDTMVVIDEEKIKQDESWDGLKGYLTNTHLSAAEIIENYKHLWQIEKAFRISKTDLRIRPVYHYLRKRIEAHICIAFVAYTIYKELERLLEAGKTGMSPKRAAELTHTMYELNYSPPCSAEKKRKLLKLDEEQQLLYNAIYN